MYNTYVYTHTKSKKNKQNETMAKLKATSPNLS